MDRRLAESFIGLRIARPGLDSLCSFLYQSRWEAEFCGRSVFETNCLRLLGPLLGAQPENFMRIKFRPPIKAGTPTPNEPECTIGNDKLARPICRPSSNYLT
jgi:hypothetical protein